MPAKKKGGTTDDAAAKMASYMLPVPAPSSMRAWSGAQSLQDDAQMPDLEGYVPVGDLLRDYVFMCKGMGVSPHPCIVNRIRRPMTVVEVRRFRRHLLEGAPRQAARIEALKATQGRRAAELALLDSAADAVEPDAGYPRQRALPFDPDAAPASTRPSTPSSVTQPSSARSGASRPVASAGTRRTAPDAAAAGGAGGTPGAKADGDADADADDDDDDTSLIPPPGGESVPMDAFDLTSPLAELRIRGFQLDSATVRVLGLTLPYAASLRAVRLSAVEVAPSNVRALRRWLAAPGSWVQAVALDHCTPLMQAAAQHESEEARTLAAETAAAELRAEAVRVVGCSPAITTVSLRGMRIGDALPSPPAPAADNSADSEAAGSGDADGLRADDSMPLSDAASLLAARVAMAGSLTSLDVSENILGVDAALALLEGVRESASLRCLSLGRCGLGPAATSALLGALLGSVVSAPVPAPPAVEGDADSAGGAAAAAAAAGGKGGGGPGAASKGAAKGGKGGSKEPEVAMVEDDDAAACAARRETLDRFAAAEVSAAAAETDEAAEEAAAAVAKLGGAAAEHPDSAGADKGKGGSGGSAKASAKKGAAKGKGKAGTDSTAAAVLRPGLEGPLGDAEAMATAHAFAEAAEAGGAVVPSWAAAWVAAASARAAAADAAAAASAATAAAESAGSESAAAPSSSASSASRSKKGAGKSAAASHAQASTEADASLPRGPPLSVVKGASGLEVLDVAGNELGAASLGALVAGVAPLYLVDAARAASAGAASDATATGKDASAGQRKGSGAAGAGSDKRAGEWSDRAPSRVKLLLASSIDGVGAVSCPGHKARVAEMASRLLLVGVQLLA